MWQIYISLMRSVLDIAVKICQECNTLCSWQLVTTQVAVADNSTRNLTTAIVQTAPPEYDLYMEGLTFGDGKLPSPWPFQGQMLVL